MCSALLPDRSGDDDEHPRPVVDAAAELAADLSALKYIELRDMCKSKGLSTSGKKEELIARLLHD
jgi:hypothetical protein